MIFLFDGDCAFCTSSANLLRQIVKDRFPVTPYQHADLEKLGLTEEACSKAVQYFDGKEVHVGSLAIAKALVNSKTTWAIAGLLMQLPVVSSAGFLVYEWVAKNRHKLPGGTPACQIPTER